MPDNQNVPDEIGVMAPDFVGAGGTPIEQLRAMEHKFQEVGFYANGKDAPSRPSHTTSRITDLLAQPQMIGDDEQYAVAMALMVRQLGYPARVVMGFYPEVYPDGPVEITGWDAHAWVEVPFEGHGWVPFDPTPDRNKTPDSQVPKPKEIPEPQVLPPPEPPDEPVVPPEDRSDSANNRKEEPARPDLPKPVLVALYVAGGLGALATPFLCIIALKRLRRTKRRTTGAPVDRIVAGWHEVVDTAGDLGQRPDRRRTRQEAAAALDASFAKATATPSSPAGAPPSAEPSAGERVVGPVGGSADRGEDDGGAGAGCGDVGALALARSMDAQVYGEADPSPDDVSRLWREVDEVLAGMRSRVPWWRRVLGAVSPRSLVRDKAASVARALSRRGQAPDQGSVDTHSNPLGSRAEAAGAEAGVGGGVGSGAGSGLDSGAVSGNQASDATSDATVERREVKTDGA